MKEISETIISLNNPPDQDARRFMSEEIQFRDILPRWISKICSVKFKAALQMYFDYLQAHIQKLESLFEDEKIPTGDIKSRFMLAFIEKTNEKLSHYYDGQIRDIYLLTRVQSIIHFKISSYGAAASFANALNMKKYGAVFYDAEVNEQNICDRLSQLAEPEINSQAVLSHGKVRIGLFPSFQNASKCYGHNQ